MQMKYLSCGISSVLILYIFIYIYFIYTLNVNKCIRILTSVYDQLGE